MLNLVEQVFTIAHELGINNDGIERRKDFLEFTGADAALLQQLHDQLGHYGDEFAKAFYDHVLAFPELRALAPDKETLAHLKETQSAYFKGLTSGDYGADYVHHRLRVGITHQRVGLDPQWYIGAYRKYLSFFLSLLWRLHGEDTGKFLSAYEALLKIVMFDMELAIDTYIYAEKHAVAQAEQRLRNLIEGVDAIVWEVDATTGCFAFVSSQAQAMLGYPPECWVQKPDFWRTIIRQEDRAATVAFIQQEIAAGHSYDVEYRIVAADGRTVWVHERGIAESNDAGSTVRGLMVDITSRKEAESKLAYMATHDELTGLPNRALLLDRLSQAMAQADRNNGMVAVLFIDLDRFKFINDSLGHDIGDAVLQTAAGRLVGCIREVDTVARLGGDEFVVLLSGISRIEDVTSVARKVLQTLMLPFTADARELLLTASIGISAYPKDGTDAQMLLKNADAAMYRAKERGKNRFEFFTEDLNALVMRRLQLEHQLRQALERNEFILHYQPQAELESGRIVGVEALVRWHHPEMGLVSPAEFIPLAEEIGLIEPIGEWVLTTACRQAVAWQAAGLPPLRMAVNLSARQVKHDLANTIMRITHETSFDPELLELELTEGLLVQGTEQDIAVLHALRKQGVNLSVDDFGTGYSSLSYLNRFPVTAIKIDRTFVQGVTSDPGAAALASSIISMAHELRLEVIAEGVESKGHLHFLADRKCNVVQGYYLSRPVPADECAAFLRQFPGLSLQRKADAPERTLLLVDDEVNISIALKRLLRRDGYCILTATSGMEGLELLATHPVEVVVSDQRMPGMSGAEFLRRVKKLYPDTIRMMLSGYTDLKSVTDAINEGSIYKFMTKPWEDEQIRELVREAFQWYELKEKNRQ